jgi:uncharacterized Zn finger protein
MSSWSDYPEYPASTPLPVDGGIVARSRRGDIGETWWSRRFIELLESFGVGSRLKRGRNYARKGQVIELEVEPGVVLAKVQGSRYTPYRVRIRGKVLSEAQWRRAEKAMASQALPLAQLLAGEMPRDIEAVFASCKLTLLPSSKAELKASCTCPDSENPCKHVAAVYYILAERFDEDPFLIFAWRGLDKPELLERLRARRGAGGRRRAGDASRHGDVAAEAQPAVPLSAQLESFWSVGPELAEVHVNPFAGTAPSALLRQLGPAPLDVAGQNLVELLSPAYIALAEAAARRALDE